MRVLVLSGPVGAGKTTTADAVAARYSLPVIKTRDLILSARPRTRRERSALQRAGEALDRESDGGWVAEELGKLASFSAAAAFECAVVDSVRIPQQIEALRRAFGVGVIHVHITADDRTLEARYTQRTGSIVELSSYADVRRNKTERQIHRMADIADAVIDTSRSRPADTAARIAALLGFFADPAERLVDVLVGGQWGSEGKGHVAHYLAPEYDLLIRTGGPNAGHTVYEGPTQTYTHHLLPSGTRRCEAKLLLGPGACIYVPKLLKEIAECEVDHTRLAIDPRATIISDEHRERETVLRDGMGSTASGGGAAIAARIMGRAGGAPLLAKDVPILRPYIRESQEVLELAYRRGHRIFVEGTQGTGLSLLHGDYPHVTARDTTVSGLCAEAGIPPARVRHVILVCRTYPIRVASPAGGTSGDMGIEVDWHVVAERAGLEADELVAVEKTSTTRRGRRVAEFSWDQLRRSAALNGPTDVALTFADYIDAANRSARRFEQLSEATINFVMEVERVAKAPVSLLTTRFHERSIIDRRTWART